MGNCTDISTIPHNRFYRIACTSVYMQSNKKSMAFYSSNCGNHMRNMGNCTKPNLTQCTKGGGLKCVPCKSNAYRACKNEGQTVTIHKK